MVIMVKFTDAYMHHSALISLWNLLCLRLCLSSVFLFVICKFVCHSGVLQNLVTSKENWSCQPPMMTPSNGNIFCVTGPLCRNPLVTGEFPTQRTVPSYYLNQCWDIVNQTLGNKLQWNLNQNLWIFIQVNAFEYVVWKMAAILSRPQCGEILRQLYNYPSIIYLTLKEIGKLIKWIPKRWQ